MTNASFARCSALLPSSILPSLTAVACLSCLAQFGVDCGLHMATASALFVFGYTKETESNPEIQIQESLNRG